MNTFLMIVLGLVSLVIIVAVMFQQSSGDGAGALGGSTGMAKKAKGNEALLTKITVVASAIFVILTIVLVVLNK